MRFKLLYVNLSILIFYAQNNHAEVSINSKLFLNAPQKLSNCKAKLDDGSIVDLTSQDKSSTPRFIYKKH